MNIKALITALVIGSSSVAMAKPAVTVSAEASVHIGARTRGPVVRDHRYQEPVYRQPVRGNAYQPEAFYTPRNTQVSSNLSLYTGSFPMTQVGGWDRNWLALSEPTRIDSGRLFFNVGQSTGSFRTIKLQNVAGSSQITTVAIEFNQGVGGSNGVTQVVKMNSTLRGQQSLTIDLDGNARNINRIIVYGSTANGSAFSLQAR